MQRINVSEMLFADDIVLLAESEQNLQYNLNILNEEMVKKNMKININETKSMIIVVENKTHNITIENIRIEQVNQFK